MKICSQIYYALPTTLRLSEYYKYLALIIYYHKYFAFFQILEKILRLLRCHEYSVFIKVLLASRYNRISILNLPKYHNRHAFANNTISRYFQSYNCNPSFCKTNAFTVPSKLRCIFTYMTLYKFTKNILFDICKFPNSDRFKLLQHLT